MRKIKELIGKYVNLIPFEGVEGRIKSVLITSNDVEYGIRFYMDGEIQEAYFLEDEVELIVE